MKILKNIGETINNAIDYLAEKKRKFDKINRIRKHIKEETGVMVKNYILLGKYYYAELRDVPNKDMQRICDAIDSSKLEIKKLKCKLEEVHDGCDIKFYCNTSDDDEIYTESCCTGCSSCENYCDCGTSCDCEDSKVAEAEDLGDKDAIEGNTFLEEKDKN